MFELFAEGIENLSTTVLEQYARKIPALWEEFAVRDDDGKIVMTHLETTLPKSTQPGCIQQCQVFTTVVHMGHQQKSWISWELCSRFICWILSSWTYWLHENVKTWMMAITRIWSLRLPECLVIQTTSSLLVPSTTHIRYTSKFLAPNPES